MNYASSVFDEAVPLSTLADTAFRDLIAEVEAILNDPLSSHADFEHAKDLAEAVNQHDKDNADCDTGTGSKSGMGTASKSTTGGDPTGTGTASKTKGNQGGKK